MKKKDVKITIIDSLGPKGCHRGHRVGDTFSYDKDRGRICPMAMHVAFPYIDILRYGGAEPYRINRKERLYFVVPMWTLSTCLN